MHQDNYDHIVWFRPLRGRRCRILHPVGMAHRVEIDDGSTIVLSTLDIRKAKSASYRPTYTRGFAYAT